MPIEVFSTYDRRSRRKIWRKVEDLKSEYSSPTGFAGGVVGLFEECGLAMDVAVRDSTATAPVTRKSVKQLVKYADYNIEDALDRIQDDTWRFLDVATQRYSNRYSAGIKPSALDHIGVNSQKEPNCSEENFSGSYLLKSESCDGGEWRTGVLDIGRPVDDNLVVATLWVNLVPGKLIERIRSDFFEERFEEFVRWDGFARFNMPPKRTKATSGLFFNHDLYTVLRSYNLEQPGALIIQQPPQNSDDSRARCRILTPHTDIEYDVTPIQIGDE